MSSVALAKSDYHIGIITALPIELAAITAMLDVKYELPPHDFEQFQHDPNAYTWGCIGSHNVVIATLATGVYGHTMATTTALPMLYAFPNIKFGLMVGIGAGVPNHRDVRLGDVVVSQPSGNSGGVFQYDLGKASHDKWARKDFLARPPDVLLKALSSLQAEHEFGTSKAHEYFQNAINRHHQRWAKSYKHPGTQDKLFESSYLHRQVLGNNTCLACDPSNIIDRPPREFPTDFEIHYGVIASGNSLVKSAELRDKIATMDEECICIEMEAAGLMNNFPCLVIRGICDYADSHKNDAWQRYAAATAAAFTKELLGFVPRSKSKTMTSAVEIVVDNQLETTLSPDLEIVKPSRKNNDRSHTFNAAYQPLVPILDTSQATEESIAPETRAQDMTPSSDDTVTQTPADWEVKDSSKVSRIKPTEQLMVAKTLQSFERTHTSLQRTANVDAKDSSGADVNVKNSGGAKVNTEDPEDRIAFHVAGGVSDAEPVRYSLEFRADIKLEDSYKRNALHIAVQYRHVGIVEVLLEHGIDVNSRECYQRTPLHLAILPDDFDLYRDPEVSDSPLQAHKPVPLGSKARDLLDMEMTTLLLDNEANVQALDFNDFTPLHYAVGHGRTNLVRLLLTRKADTKTPNKQGTTALHLAVTYSYVKIVKLLVKNGADVHAKDSDDRSPVDLVKSIRDDSKRARMASLLGLQQVLGSPSDQVGRNVCDFCTKEDIRCNGQSPCSACVARNLDCART